MSSFSRSALEMLQAAEEALTQPRTVRAARRPNSAAYTHKTIANLDDVEEYYTAYRDPHNSCTPGPSDAPTVRELQSQLGKAMRELIELRAELAAERDRRNETLVALGRQWKEEVMVAVHRRDSALQSDVSALEEKLTVQWKESNESRLVLRRQLEEAMRAAKVRDTDRFQLREELQETTRQLEERVEVAMAQSTAARADCSRQLEQERASLSQRLDSELLRLVEMRREDQRALQEARDAVRHDSQRMREEVRRAVQEVWEASAAALVKTATEPVEVLRAELRQCKTAVQAADEKVADCVRSCQAESRVHITATAERLHALESKEAVAASRVDRAERKADGAYEVAGRMEAAVQSAREASERAQLQAASALERAQKVDHALRDRDERLVAVESHLHGVSTAEGLKAEVEACKRQSGRLESRMDATSAMCERVEQLADKTVRQVSDFTQRIATCEKSAQRSTETVQEVHETVVACQAECQQTRARHDVTDGVVQRHGQLMTQLEQRVMGQENRLGLWRQQQEQHVKDQQNVQREMTERAEVTHAAATRAQQVSSDARAEVSRLERRFDDVDRALVSGNTEGTALRASLESLRSQIVELQRLQPQLEDQLRAMETRVQERVVPLAELERNVAQRFERSEAQVERVGRKIGQCEKQLQEMGGRVQDYVKDTIRHHLSESQRRLLAALNDGVKGVSERVNTLEGTLVEVQERVDDTPSHLKALQDGAAALQRGLQGVEARLHDLQGHVEQLSLHAEAQTDDRQRLGTMQHDLTRLLLQQQRLEQDVLQLHTSAHTLRDMQLSTSAQMRDQTLSNLGGSQAQTATTEMARSQEIDSSSPSARIPAGGAGPHPASYGSTASASTIFGQQRSSRTTVIPPLVSTTNDGPTPQARQDQQRASSSGSGSGSKGSSEERPASHLSGVSSVRPPEEGVERLNSVAEAAVPTASSSSTSRSSNSASIDDRSRGGRVASVPLRQSFTLPNTRTVSATAAVETAEQLSATGVPPSTQASALANTSHPTVIRGFTTIDTTSSDSESDVDGMRAQQNIGSAAQPVQQHARGEEHTEDVSSDLTTALTTTSEAAATPHRVGSGGAGSRRVRPAAVQRRTTAMTTAWGQASSDSSVDDSPVAPARATQPATHRQEEEMEATSMQEGRVAQHDGTPASASHSDDSDVVQAVATQASDDGGDADATDDVEPVRSAAATPTTAAPPASTERTESPMPAPRHPEWDDWDEEASEDEADKRVGSTPAAVAAPSVARAHSSDESDLVMQMNEVEDVEAVNGAQQPHESSRASSTSSGSSAAPSAMAATTIHQRRAGGGGEGEDLRATERRTFVATAAFGSDDSPEPRHVVPRHGQNTTSSSSSSAERAETLGLRVAGSAASTQRPQPQVRQYTNFDDSTTSDDE